MVLEETTLRIAVSFGILLLGYLVASLGSNLLTKIYRKRFNVTIKRAPIASKFRYAVMGISIIIVLLFLKIDISQDFFIDVYDSIPNILSIILVFILVIMVGQFVMFVVRKFLSKSGITEFAKDYGKKQLLDLGVQLIAFFVYLILVLAALDVVGIDVGGIAQTLGFILYPFLILLLVLLFVGFKDIAENYFGGFYMKYSNHFNLGQKVKVDNNEGTIKRFNSQGVILKKDKDYDVFVPNKIFLRNSVLVKRIKFDLDTLEEIKNYFVAQDPSYCGPASASMILKIFGYGFSQEKIGEDSGTKVGKGVRPRDLIKTVEKLTEEKVKGAWIDANHISGLKTELKGWLNDGGLVIVDYQKKILFPESKKAHYTVGVAVQGDELLCLDPNKKTGGVYFVNIDRLYRGMNTYSKLIKGKRGYIVLAPEGTKAYYRIENGLVYSNIDFYKKLNKKLRGELTKIISKAEDLGNILPRKVKKVVKDYKKKDKVDRVWKPK